MQNINRRLLAGLLLGGMLLGAATGCRQSSSDAEDTTTASLSQDVQAQSFTLVEDGKGLYDIVYNKNDPYGALLAKQVQRVILDATGIRMKVKSAESEYGNAILVGESGCAETMVAKAKLGSASDFILDFTSQNLVLYANDAALVETMLSTLRVLLQERYEEQ